MTDILCSRCEEKKAKPRPTYDGIVWLVGILARSGFAVEILGLYAQFDIDDVADLAPLRVCRIRGRAR
jgi:hypothetical protein